jgi:hypothetical protein
MAGLLMPSMALSAGRVTGQQDTETGQRNLSWELRVTLGANQKNMRDGGT